MANRSPEWLLANGKVLTSLANGDLLIVGDISEVIDADSIKVIEAADLLAQIQALIDATVPVHDHQTDYIGTQETLSIIGTWEDLATVGPEIEIEVGPSGIAVISMFTRLKNSTASGVAAADIAVDGVNDSQDYPISGTQVYVGGSMTKSFAGLSPGPHTFKIVYLCSLGTATFANRRISGYSL